MTLQERMMIEAGLKPAKKRRDAKPSIFSLWDAENGKALKRTDGGPGSGNFGHRGRIGEVGGSVSDSPFDSSKCNVSFGFGDELPKKDVDRALSLCGAKEINPGENDEVRVRKGPDGVIRAQVETPETYAKVFIRDDRKELYLDELFLKNKGTGKGTAIVNEMVHQAESNGLETIRLIGGGIKGDSMNGYYSFARLGFDQEDNDEKDGKEGCCPAADDLYDTGD